MFLIDRNDIRKGQIAHLNRNPSDCRFENLVFLCLEHHDEYDSRPSQSKGLSAEEVRAYRDRLYQENGTFKSMSQLKAIDGATDLLPLPPTTEYEVVRKRFPEELDFTATTWRFPLWQVANEMELFAYKAGNSDGVCLVERIDLPDGRIVVVCIQVAGNPGTSITNCVEELCFQVCERFEIPAEQLVWIEHYDYDDHAEWSIVHFTRMPPDGPFEGPTWTPMTPRMWHELRLKPKERLRHSGGRYESKIKKLFHWRDQAFI